MKTGAERQALWKALARIRNILSEAEQDRLRNRLAESEKDKVLAFLHSVRTHAFAYVRAKSKKERDDLIVSPDGEHAFLLPYAAAAWIVRTLWLMEQMERFDPGIRGAGGAEHAYRFVEAFEVFDGWLWPFESEGPWPDIYENGEEESY